MIGAPRRTAEVRFAPERMPSEHLYEPQRKETHSVHNAILRTLARMTIRCGGGSSPAGLLSLGIAGAVALSGANALAADSTETPSPGEIYNYIVGFQITTRVMQKLQQDGVEISPEPFRLGIEDQLAGKTPRFTEEQVLASIKTLQAERKGAVAAQSQANLAEGKAFLADNAKKENVVVLDSGLQYVESQAGTGAIPTADTMVMVHYRGTLLNGEEFDSSHARGQPAKFAPGGVVPGFREALLKMREGAKWRVFIPSELAYGERGPGGKIGPNQTLIFDLELLEIVKE